MKGMFLLLLHMMTLCFCIETKAQKIKNWKVQEINLPADIAYYDNQFSSLYISDGNLYLMSESRIEDHSPAFVAYANLKDIQHHLEDSSFRIPFHRIPLKNLDVIRDILQQRNQSYEGLEAMTIDKKFTFYFSIETATPSDSCYVIKGVLQDSAIVLDTAHFLALAKSKNTEGKNVYNAGYEALEIHQNKLLAFFEYNYFTPNSFIAVADTALKNNALHYEKIDSIPFRITDISWNSKQNALFAINYFYDGGGGDAVYRVPESDKNYALTQKNGHYNSYTRLVQIKKEKNGYQYEPMPALPESYWQYNWEGIATYKKGIFLINDKYTPHRPYRSVLIYITPQR